MKLKQLFLILLTLGVGASLAMLVLRQPAGESHDHGDHGHGHGHGHEEHEDETPRGPQGGRLLETDGLRLEITIFEKGVPPEYRVYAYTKQGQPVPPEQVKLTIELKRLGDHTDTITFQPMGGFLRGQQEVVEPHSFDVTVRAEFQGRKVEWTYESPEGRVKIPAALAASSGVTTELAGPATLRQFRDLPAQVRLNEDQVAHAVSRFKGQIITVHKNLGDTVKAGEVLAVLDSRELADARAEFIEALHKLELTQAVYAREEKLWQKKISAEQDFLVIKHELEEAEIKKQTARQKLLALGLQEQELADLSVEPTGKVVTFQARQPFPAQALTRYEVRSPISGTVIRKSVTLGSPVTEDADLFLIADLGTVWVDAAVPAIELAEVQAGQMVKVISGKRQAEGKVTYVGPAVDADTRAGFIRVVIANGDRQWKPGEFATVQVLEQEVAVAVAVRPEALQTFRDWTVVFQNVGDEYEVLPVETGRRTGEWVEVLSGLKPGQRYVTGNSYLIKADILKSGASHDH
jgi:cobalt-zinc-cadmium efflux system membrane fusion protein